MIEVELQAATHGADHARLKVGVQEILKVGDAVFRGHLEEPGGVGVIPWEVAGDVVCWDGEGEDPAAPVTGGHDLEEGLVDHPHLFLEFPVGEVHLLVAHSRVVIAQVVGACPVERDVGERRLGAPAGGDVEVVNKLLYALLDLAVAHVVGADVGGEVGVEAAEGLCAGPLVLQRAEEVDHLADCGRHVFRGGCLDLAGPAVEALIEQVAQ